MSDIVVFGSMNMDATAHVRRLPAPGETVLGGPVTYTCGGKGGNQAAAAGRILAAPGGVRMAGLVGRDQHGEALRADLRDHGVDVTQVRSVDEAGTGLAMIAVDQDGENTIVVSPGANECWRPDRVRAIHLAAGDIVVCQIEVPVWAVAQMVERAHEHGAQVILNAAPPQVLPAPLLAGVTVLIINESEAALVLGATPASPAALDQLAAHLSCAVVVTLGARGALVREPACPAQSVAAFPITTVSAVGAGDAFVGALAVELLADRPLIDAVRRACGAGALAATAAGARGGLPTGPEIDAFLERSPC